MFMFVRGGKLLKNLNSKSKSNPFIFLNQEIKRAIIRPIPINEQALVKIFS